MIEKMCGAFSTRFDTISDEAPLKKKLVSEEGKTQSFGNPLIRGKKVSWVKKKGRDK